MFDFKYAEFIVPSFVVTAMVFVGMLVLSLSHSRRWKRRYEELSGRRDGEA